MNQVRGVLPVVQTPYMESGMIDFRTLEREIDWLFDAGVDGIVIAMVSEVLRLSAAERGQLAEAACAMASERGPVVVSVGAESTVVAREHARHAERCGASALMAIPPVATPADEGELRAYFEGIAVATELPLVVQDASGYVGRPMSIDLQASLFRDLGDRILFKPEASPIGPRLSALRDATGGKARIFEGTGGSALLDSYRRGIVGTMPGADLIRGIVALWRALESDAMDRAYAVSAALCPLLAMQNSLDSFLAIEKYLLVKQGVFRNTLVRGPVGYRLDEETRAEVDRLYDRLSDVLAEQVLPM